MSEAAIRARIKTIMEGVSGIGTVHAYERWAHPWEKFLELFKDSSNKINGATISRFSTSSVYGPRRRQRRTHKYRIRMYYGLKDADATEVTFQAMVEGAVTALSADGDLGGTTPAAGPVQVAVVEPRMFGSVLCHYAELVTGVVEEAALTQ